MISAARESHQRIRALSEFPLLAGCTRRELVRVDCLRAQVELGPQGLHPSRRCRARMLPDRTKCARNDAFVDSVHDAGTSDRADAGTWRRLTSPRVTRGCLRGLGRNRCADHLVRGRVVLLVLPRRASRCDRSDPVARRPVRARTTSTGRRCRSSSTTRCTRCSGCARTCRTSPSSWSCTSSRACCCGWSCVGPACTRGSRPPPPGSSSSSVPVQNILWAFQIGFVGSLVFGLAPPAPRRPRRPVRPA